MYRVGDFNYKKLISTNIDKYDYSKLINRNIFDDNTSSNPDVVNAIVKSMQNNYLPIDEERTNLDRIFDALSVGNYTVAGAVRGAIRDDMTVGEGFMGGLRASNPFGDGYAKGEHTYSKALGDLGWNPTSTGGKIAKGTLGFIGDVFLDPTTYLSGGGTALLKGTGKVGAKATHNLAEGMTKEIAEGLIVKQANARGIKISAEEVVKDAEKLTKEFNRIIGIKGKADDLTFSLANAPFGNKIFGEYANASKTLATGDKLQEIGDKTLAPQYSKLRDSIYGSKLGKLFGANTTLYNLSKTEPDAVYDFLKFTEYTRGIGKDLQATKKAIHEKAKTLNLTPEETTQVIKMMEDKSTWSTITKHVKFAETEEAKNLKKTIQKGYDRNKAKLDKLTDIKKSVEALKFAKESEMFDASEALQKLEKEYSDAITNLDVTKIKDKTQLKSVIKSLDYEIKKLKVEEDEFYKTGVKKIKPEDIIKSHDEFKQLKELSSKKQAVPKDVVEYVIPENAKYLKNIDTVVTKPEKAGNKHYAEVIKQLEKNGYVSTKKSATADKFAEYYKGWTQELDMDSMEYRMYPPKSKGEKVILQKAEPLKKANKGKLVEDISELLYGRRDFISTDTWDSNIDELIYMVKANKRIEEIQRYIEKKADYFNGRANLIYPHISKELKYDKWSEHYTDVMDKLKDKVRKGTVTDEELEQIAKLQQDKLKRDKMIRTFKGMETEDIRKMIDDANGGSVGLERYYDLSSIQNMLYTEKWADQVDEQQLLRDEKIKNDSSLDELHNLNTPSIKNFKTKDNADRQIGSARMTYEDKYYLSNMIIEKVLAKNPKFKLDDISNVQKDWVEGVMYKAERLLDDMFQKDFFDLSDAQLNILADKAIQMYNNSKNSKNIVFDIKESIANAQKQVKQTRADNFRKQVKEGATVHFTDKGGNKLYGVVKSFGMNGEKPVMEVMQNNGRIIKNVGFDSINKLRNDVKLLSSEEILKMSTTAGEFIAKHDELLDKIIDAQKQLKESDSASKVKALLDDVTSRKAQVEKNIVSLEQTMSHLQDALDIGELTKIDRLTSRVKTFGDALANDDAFETYMRVFLSHETVDEVIKKNSPTSTIFNNTLKVSEKVTKIVKDLRVDLLNIGSSEVAIDKLKEVQFVKMMNNYLPHILTEEGKKIFENTDEIVKIMPGFGDDLGYGRKFNPYGKSRTIKWTKDVDGKWIENPNILEINDYFKREFPELKGKNVFQENIADIYLSRALKNTELLYDHKYTTTMMDIFGTTLDNGAEVKEGYKAVANYGQLREYVRDTARSQVNLAIANAKARGVKIIEGDFKIMFESHITKLLDDMGLPKKALDDLATPMVELTPDQIKKIQKIQPDMVKQVNDAIVNKANQTRKMQIAKDESRFLQIYDKFTHFIKLNQTTVLLSFHMRNKLANTFNNWLAIGSDAVNIDFQKKAFHAMKNNGEVEGMLKLTKSDGSVAMMEWSEVYQLAKEYGVIDDGFFAKDLGAGAMSKGLIKKLPAKLDPTDTKNFMLYKKGVEIGGKIEGQDRLIHFASQLSRGMNPEDASKSVDKYLFDYSDLTAFEQSVMKRIMPYYTWLRKNAPLQLERMMEDPKKYQMIAKIEHGIEGMVNEEDRIDKRFVNNFAKDWVQTPFNVMNEEGRQEPVLWNPNLPFMDIGRIPDVFNPIESAKDIFTQTNPIIKTPIEQIANRNVFFDSPIVDEGDNQIAKRTEHVLSQFGAYPVAKGFMGKSGADIGLHTLNTTSGIKMLSYDYEKYKAMKIQELLKKQDKNKQQLKK